MLVETIPVGVFQCNCVILACERTRRSLIVDPGDDPQQILQRVRGYGLEVGVVLHTHAHLDHIMGSAAVVESTGAIARLHERDRKIWNGAPWLAAKWGIPPPALPPLGDPIEDGEVLVFGDHHARIVHTPGHTAGSCCLLVKAPGGEHLAISGDTLLRGSVGWGRRPVRRPDDLELLRESIRSRLLVLDGATRVIPGHGPDTRIDIERETNPFLAECGR